MTDKIEELERLIRACAEDAKRPEPLPGYPECARLQPPSVLMLASGLEAAADALAALRTQRNEVVEECARVASSWSSSLRPGSLSRLHGHREAAQDIATAIRNLKSEDEPR